MKKILLVLITGALIVCAATSSFALAAGYATPEETANAFVEALAQSALDRALEIHTAEPMAKAYDWTRMVEDLKVYMPTSYEMPAPSDYGAYQALNIAVSRGRFASSLYAFIASFFQQDGLGGVSFTGIDDAWADAYIQSVDPSRLESLRVYKLLDPPQSSTENVLAVFAKQASRYGADELVEKIVVYQLGDKFFIGGLTFFRYGEYWYIHQLYSNLAGISAPGQALEVPDGSLDAFLLELTTL